MRRATDIRHKGDWPEAEALATVTLAFLDRHRRRIRLVADDGAPFLLDLPHAAHLADGDGLCCEGGGFIRVKAAPEDLLEIACADVAALARIAWHLGNRHLPVQVVGGRLRIRADHVIADMVQRLGAEAIKVRAPFDPETGAYAGGPGAHHHDHDPDEHGHDHGHAH
jgi:urease accessory protein